MIIEFLISIFLIWSIYVLVKVRLSPLVKIPGYQLYNPVLGNMWRLSQQTIFNRWQTSYEKFGTIYRWYTIMGHTYITTSSPDYIKHVLVTNSKNYARGAIVGVEVFQKIVGDYSMLVIDGDAHRRHRSIVSPAFRISNLRKLIPTMHECAVKLCNHFDDLIKAGDSKILPEVDIRQHLSHVTLTIIGLAGFGFDFDCIDKPNKLAEVLSSLNGSKSPTGLLRMLPYSYYYPFPSTRHFWNCLWTVHSIIDNLVKSKRDQRQDTQGYMEKDLLDMILENADKDEETGKADCEKREAGTLSLGDAGTDTASQAISDKSSQRHHKVITTPSSQEGTDKLSQRELRDEVMTFIMAGHETSSLALTWSISMLCLHQDWQEKCRQEILDLVSPDQTITWDHLEQLKFTKAVVHETMRLWPPIPAVSRNAKFEDQLGPYHIPAGTSIICLSGQMHRLPEYWPNPTEFKPERFLEDDVPWDAYLPFGDGPHKCLGYQFALSEIIVVLVTLLRKYRFELAMDWNELKVQGFVTLQPMTPILVDIKPIS